ncbi:hypothetical protein BC940DRAFT_299692 [Gongronella butleri]|nr:hypothetical protein BC940DRAFT_299692 [Gongronella butleri]
MTWTMQIPTEPTPDLVKVTDISGSTNEKSLRDFFAFCGKIKDVDLQPDGDNQKAALIMFETSKAADTAVLMSQAFLDGQPIQVAHYFTEFSIKEDQGKDGAPSASAEDKKSEAPDEKKAAGDPTQLVSKVMAEVMAGGYRLGDQVLAKGIEFDHKYGVRDTVQKYYEQLQQNAQKLDDQYHVRDKTGPLEEKVQEQHKQATDRAQKWLQENPTGQKVADLITRFNTQITALHEEAKRITVTTKRGPLYFS